MTTKQTLISFFYCDSIGSRAGWGGWNRFFDPCIPGRLFSDGFRALREAIECPERVGDAVDFLSSSHTKYLSQAGTGEPDVECRPTDEARKAVELLLDYSQANAGGMARELAALDSDNTTDLNG